MPTAVMTYPQAIDFLFGRINYERAASGSYSSRDLKLERMRRLLALLGDPHLRIGAVHIAGTKGKGSTAVMTAEMLSAAGYRVGLFTSPHLARFEERIRVGGISPNEDQVVDLVGRLRRPVDYLDARDATMRPTYFEIATAMAWLHFTDQQANLAVMETGLGGRLDSTNLCRPEVTVITSISRDHTALLGGTIEKIAAEKAGIIKENVPVISGVSDGPAADVIRQASRNRHAELYRLHHEIHVASHPAPQHRIGMENRQIATADINTPWQRFSAVPLPLRGVHQAGNAALAVSTVDLLSRRGFRAAADAVTTGLANVQWPIRIEQLGDRPTVIVDAAHNDASVKALLATLNSAFPARRRILVFAASRDKDVPAMLFQFRAEFDVVIATEYVTNPRTMRREELRQTAAEILDMPVHSAKSPHAAWRMAKQLSSPDDLICVTGSFFLAAEMRDIIRNVSHDRDCDMTPPTNTDGSGSIRPCYGA